jgi:hypothetical protein
LTFIGIGLWGLVTLDIKQTTHLGFSMNIVAFVETDWNLLSLLCYLDSVEHGSVLIITPNGVKLPLSTTSEKIAIHRIFTSDNKLRKLIDFNRFRRLIKTYQNIYHVDQFVCFSSFSPICNFIQKKLNIKLNVLLDDGFLLYNMYHPSQNYGLTGPLKFIFYRLLIGEWPRFKFVDFNNIDKAYLLFKDGWLPFLSKEEQDKIHLFSSLVNLDSLYSSSERYLCSNFINEVKVLGRKLKPDTSLFLGTGLVRHNFISISDYEKLLYKLAGTVLFKPHPSEIDLDISYPHNFSLLNTDVPIELIMSYRIHADPDMPLIVRLAGFGSTTQFFLFELLSFDSDFYLSENVFNDDFCLFLSNYIQNSNIVRV